MKDQAKLRKLFDLPGARRMRPVFPEHATVRFGQFGGQFVPETLMAALDEFEAAYEEAETRRGFPARARRCSAISSGAPRRSTSPSGSPSCRRPQIYLKREDLTHTGAHKINNAIGQALLAKRMGKQRIIAETGAGQHGVATATACALLGLECVVYMGEEDIAPAGAQRLPHEAARRGGRAGRPAAAARSRTPSTKRSATGSTNVETTHYIIGSVVGPHPYPMIVRDFQSVIGARRARRPRAASAACPTWPSPASAAAQRDRHLLPLRRTTRSS